MGRGNGPFVCSWLIRSYPSSRDGSCTLFAIRSQGKEGQLCGNLVDKLVDFSARTVITGVPKSIATNLERGTTSDLWSFGASG